MLKKMIIATAFAGAAMMAVSGGVNAAPSKGFHASAPAIHLKGKVAPRTFKFVHKRRFKHGRHFHYWNSWHYRPHGCHWLKRKARWTGKRYWWKRYYACRHYYYH